MSTAGKIPARPMEYPCTLVAKLTHYPWKMMWKHANWRHKWVAIGYIACIPFYYYLHKALNCDANKEKLRLLKIKEHKEHLEHLAHLK